MKSPFNELLYINTKPKPFHEHNTVIFFDKDVILDKINNSFWKMSNYKKLKTAEKKLKKRNIYFYYYTNQELNKINKKFKFNDSNAKFNELYFKLNDFNLHNIKYYTYNNFLRYSEDYSYDFFIYLFSYFGLKSMRWSYTNSHEKTNNNNINANLGIRDHKNEFQFSTNETSKKSLGIEGFKDFENKSSLNFFDGYEIREYWYSFCKKDINTIVKKILKNSKRYSYEYYLNNESLQIRLENRLIGAKQICYEINNITHHKIIITKMIKISNIFADIGIKLNSTNIDTKNYTKKYSINFWDINDMELKTLEHILNNNTIIKNIQILKKAKERYGELNTNDISNLIKKLKIIQEQIRIQKLKSMKFSTKDFEEFNFDNKRIIGSL